MSEKFGRNKRNLVLITLDSLRADHCGFMGYHRNTTPTLDKMAQKGLCFSNAIVATLPTAPSMFTIFTGEECTQPIVDFPPEMWRKEFNKKTTLADVLTANGYDTIAIHANPWASRIYGFNKGFKYFQDFLSDNFKTGILGEIKAMLKKEVSFSEWSIIYTEVINIIEKIKRPYFLWILLLDTHVPYLPPKNFRLYGSKSTLLLLYLNWKLRRNDQYFKGKNIRFFYKLSPKEIEILKGAYDDSIRYADVFIKKLLKDLSDDDPIFIIHSDHGDGFGDHGFFYHPAMLYEELIHVPLVIYNADVKETIESPISMASLAPTILELVGIKNKFPSKSVFNYKKPWVISKVFENGKRKLSVRTKYWKYIIGQKSVDELYNLREDPHEQENVIGENPKIAEKMREIAKNQIKQELERKRMLKGIQKIKHILK